MNLHFLVNGERSPRTHAPPQIIHQLTSTVRRSTHWNIISQIWVGKDDFNLPWMLTQAQLHYTNWGQGWSDRCTEISWSSKRTQTWERWWSSLATAMGGALESVIAAQFGSKLHCNQRNTKPPHTSKKAQMQMKLIPDTLRASSPWAVIKGFSPDL